MLIKWLTNYPAHVVNKYYYSHVLGKVPLTPEMFLVSILSILIMFSTAPITDLTM